METNKLNDEELEQVNGGVFCPASSGIVDSRDKIVFRFNKGDIVNFKGGITGGFLKGGLCSARHKPPYVEIDIMPRN